MEARGESEKCSFRLAFPWAVALIPQPRQRVCSPSVPSSSLDGSSRWHQGSACRGCRLAASQDKQEERGMCCVLAHELFQALH